MFAIGWILRAPNCPSCKLARRRAIGEIATDGHAVVRHWRNPSSFERVGPGDQIASVTLMFRDGGGHEELTETIIGCAIRVHDALGPGLLESIYKKCMVIELNASSLQVEVDRRIPLTYRGIPIDDVFIPDFIVDGVVVVEIKAVERMIAVHQAQVISYLKLTGCPVGLLMNFHSSSMTSGVRRLVRPDLYRRPMQYRYRLEGGGGEPSSHTTSNRRSIQTGDGEERESS